MEDNNLKNQFSADLIEAVSKVLNTEAEQVDEKRGLWDNIHAKQKRIKNGSGEHMRKPGSEGAPTAADLKASQTEEVSLDEKHGGADYAIYHKSYTDAVDHALSHHSKYGLNASDDDRFHHIGLMSKKPSEGNTTTVNLPAKDHTTGKDHTIHMQVYNRGGSHPYELNTYSSKNSTQRNIEKVMAKKKKALGEALIGGQAKLDVDGDGKLEKSDFKKLRNKKIASKMKETKDCSCDDVDEAVYNGHRPTGLPPGQGLPKAQQDALTAKLRDFDAKMDAAKKKFATKEEVELDEAKFRAPHDDSFVQSNHPRTGPEAKYYHKNGMMYHGREGGYNTWRVRFGDKEKGDLDKPSNDHPKRYRSFEKAKAALVAGKPVKEEVELDEGRGRPPKPGTAAYIAQQKAKEAGEAEGPEPDEHIMNQIRKAADSGMMPHKIKYADGSTHALHRVHARAVIAKYNRLKPFAKEDMQAEIAKSHEHMMKHAKD